MNIDFKSEKEWFSAVLRHISISKLLKIASFEKPPIFIGGCGRSGTSLLLAILSAHPKVYGIKQETNIFGYPRKYNSVILNRWNNYRKVFPYLLTDQKILSAERWCEKTPRNIRYFETISDEFKGKVKLIQIVRDGRAVVSSRFPLTNKYHVLPERWVNDVSKGIEMSKLNNVYTVKYEDLVSNFENTVNKIFKFIEEPITEEVLEFHKYSQIQKHGAWHDNKLKPIFKSSTDSWRNEEHKDVVSELLSNEKAIQLLKYYDYIQ